MRHRIKDGNFRLVAGIWSDSGWAVHHFSLRLHPLRPYRGDVGSASIHYSKYDVPIHYQTIFWQPNGNFHLLFSKGEVITGNIFPGKSPTQLTYFRLSPSAFTLVGNSTYIRRRTCMFVKPITDNW